MDVGGRKASPAFGLVGCGHWGEKILRDLRVLACDVTVAARSEASRSRARAGGAVEIVDGVEALSDVEAVVVAVSTSAHEAVLDEVLTLGVPVYVEKPLTCDPIAAARLADQAPDRLFVMDKWRYHAGIQELGRIARSQELGPVRGLRTTRVQWGNPHDDVDPIWVLAPHDLSIALELLGRIPVPRFARASFSNDEPTGMLGVLSDDVDFVVEVSTARAEYRRRVELLCDGGVALVADGYDTTVQVIRIGDDLSRIEHRPVDGEMPLLRELRAFVDHVRGGPPPHSSAAEGAAIVNAIALLRGLAGLDANGPP